MATYKLVNADQLDSDLTSVGNAIRSKGGTSAGLSFPAGMVSAIGAISTGVELNFDVVGGTSQPINPKENTIWVNTSKTITDWVFSATQPSAKSGRVWISTGTFSPIEFNALKKNGIQVYPISAKQYISGAWVDKTTESYQNGIWVEWIKQIFLFINGDQCADITGGWVKANIGSNTIPPRVEGNKLVIESSGHANFSVCNSFDESNWAKFKGEGYKYLCVNVSDYSTSGSSPVAYLRIMASKTNDSSIAQVTVAKPGLYSLPITNITHGQPAIITYNSTMKVTEVYFSDREVN